MIIIYEKNDDLHEMSKSRKSLVYFFFSPSPVETNFVTKIVLRIVYFFFSKRYRNIYETLQFNLEFIFL